MIFVILIVNPVHKCHCLPSAERLSGQTWFVGNAVGLKRAGRENRGREVTELRKERCRAFRRCAYDKGRVLRSSACALMLFDVSRRKLPGETEKCRLKARQNAASDW